MSGNNSINTIVNIFASPGEAFAVIKERPTFLAPLLLICLATAAVNWLYLVEVDMGWLTEQQLRSMSFIEMTDAQIEETVNAAAERGIGLTIATSIIGTFFFITLVFLAIALYLKVVSALRKYDVNYKQCLSIVSWTSLPAVLGSIATAVFILTNDVSFLGQTAINPLSFANLVQIDLSNSSALVSAALSTSPINIWSLALLAFGYRAVSRSSIGSAAAVVLVPIALIVAIIIVFI